MIYALKICNEIQSVRAALHDARQNGLTVGLVPTMGYLHEGHLSLMRRCKAENDVCVVSIFVNPAQFGPQEDFAQYPRDIERDCALAQGAGADLIFHPSAEEMYPDGYHTYIEVGTVTEGLCGASRPGHFRGVATVVAKLLHIVRPHRAYFGQKDAQQLSVIRTMARDLNLPVAIVGCPIVREPDGLAKSSRNTYLSPEERSQAVVLSQSLEEARRIIAAGERNAKAILDAVRSMIGQAELAVIDYAELVDSSTMQPLATVQDGALLALAVYFGKTRLIDNLLIEGL